MSCKLKPEEAERIAAQTSSLRNPAAPSVEERERQKKLSAQQGIVANVQRFSLHDGKGIRTVVFFKGCPFICPWCCNPENMSFVPELSYKETLSGRREVIGVFRDVEDLFREVERDRVFFEESGGGVTLSGGECMSQQDFAQAFLERCHEGELQTAIESTLAIPLRDPKRMVGCVDEFLIDFKIADRATSKKVARIDPDVRDRNLEKILAEGAHVIARLPIIPGYSDGKENCERNIETICRLGITEVDILPFHQLGEGKYDSMGKDYQMHGVPQLHDEDVAWIADACSAAGLYVHLHG